MHSDHVMAEAAAAAYTYPLNGSGAGVGGVVEGGWVASVQLDEAVAAHTQLPVLSLARCSSASPSVAGRGQVDHLKLGCVSL